MSNILLVSATDVEHSEKEIYGVPIHIVGIGKYNSAINTYKLVNDLNPDIVINFGSCANLSNYEPGTVLEVTDSINDFYAGEIYRYNNIKLNTKLGKDEVRCFSTDTFFEKNKTYPKPYQDNINSCHVAEMELYGIASICKLNDIPIYGYKWPSDDGDHLQWKINAAIGFQNFKQLFKTRFL